MHTQSQSLGQILYSRGKEARDGGDLTRAKSMWQEAVREEPNNAQYQASLANLYMKEGSYNEAIPCWRAAAKNSPVDARFVNGLGGALRHANRLAEASSYFQKARELNPENATYTQNLMECRQAQEAFREGATGVQAHEPQQQAAYHGPQPAQRQSDPVREGFRRRQAVLNQVPVSPVFDYDNDGNPGYDGAATNCAHVNRARQQMGNLTAEQALCDDGDHQIKRCDLSNIDNFPGYSALLRRRGVPQDMYEADVEYFQKQTRAHASQVVKEVGLCCATLSLSFWIDCCVGSKSDKIFTDMKKHIKEMNKRYSSYNIQWNWEVIPYAGTFITFQT